MPHLFIHAVNSEFFSRDSGADYARPEDALALGIQSAAAMAVDEFNSGKASTAIEVRVEEEDGTTLLRSVVSLSVAPLMTSIAAIDLN